MPKAKWADIDVNDIEEAKSDGRQPYEGPLPKPGMYRFKLIQAKQEKSQSGNDKLRTGWELDGSYKPEHAKYNGAPLWDHMPVMQSTAFRVKALCLALGVTSKDFYNNTVTDEDGVVTKMGPRVFKDRDVYVYINVAVEKGDEEREDQLKLRGVGYLPKKDDEGDADDAAGADADDDKPAKKAKKGEEAKPAKADGKKKGKKKGAEDDDTEPPF